MNYSRISTMFTGGKQLFIYNIDKENELLKKDYEGIGTFLRTLDKLGGRKSFGSAMILFDGYNDVADELHEIKEVREYVKELFERFPHILYYVNFELEGHHVLLSSLLDYVSLSKNEKMSPIEIEKRYGLDPKNRPKHLMYLTMPRVLLEKLQIATIEHGKKMKRKDLGEKLAYKLGKIFNKGLE